MSEDEKDGKQKKPFFILRCFAFLIDGMIVLFLSALLSAPFVNSDQMLEVADESKAILQKYSQN